VIDAPRHDPLLRVLLLLAVLTALAVGTSAMAGKPPPPSATLTLSPTQGWTGTSVTATGANFDKKATATLTFGTTNVGSAATSASGGFTKSFAVPSGYSGASKVTARTTTKTAIVSFNVTSSPPPPPDTTPPNAPSNPSANPGDRQVSLSWGASTDNVGVTGYRVFRNGNQVAAVGGSTLSYTDVGLVNGATYSYTVRAVDAAGNVSSDSNTATATPQASPDIMPPAAPAGPTANAGDAQASLDWADNSESDLDHYNVYRNGTQVASPTASNYTDSGLTNGTSYSYQVTAVDHTGNESAKSSGVSATPQASGSTGWTTIYSQDFNTDGPGIPGFTSYDGPYDSGPRLAGHNCATPAHDFVSGGAAHMLMQYEPNDPTGTCRGKAGWFTGGGMINSTYRGHDQRVTITFRVAGTQPGIAHRILPMRFLDEGTWPDAGEEDWCEAEELTGCDTFAHPPSGNVDYWNNTFPGGMTQWHTFQVERRTSGTTVHIIERLDGAVIHDADHSTTYWPNTFKRVVLQQECHADACPSGTSGSEDDQIDKLVIENSTANP
jgi:chitodextrinase